MLATVCQINICYRWGCTHEQSAIESYTQNSTKSHEYFKVTRVDCEAGTSPGGIITCTCCAKGVLEVKCPFCVNCLPQEDQDNFCMTQKNGQ